MWKKRLPSVLSIFFVIFSLATIGWLSRNVVIFGSKAAAGETPKDVQVTNITDNSFTVTYHTDDRVIGTVSYGATPSLGKVALDERDQTASVTYRIHSIKVTSLISSAKYYFSIVSGHNTYNNDTVPYQIVTAPPGAVNISSQGQQSLSGDVSLEDGSIPTEALVYISSDNSQLLSTLVKPDGGYTLSLGIIRRKDLTLPVTLSPNTIWHMQIVGPSDASTVSLLASQTNPVPLVILSKNYDFSQSTLPISQAPIANGASFPTAALPKGAGPAILSPKTQEKLQDQQPVFKGQALPNSTVQIIIRSQQEIKVSVKTDSNGNWQYRPAAPLTPGTHTVSITTLDFSGILKTLTQPFSVLVKGSQFTEPSVSPAVTATPAVTARPTATPTAIPTHQPTLTLTPTAKPTLIAALLTSTPIPTVRPTLALTATPTIIPTHLPSPTSSGSGMAKPGSSSLLVGLIVAAATIGFGLLLFILTRGGNASL